MIYEPASPDLILEFGYWWFEPSGDDYECVGFIFKQELLN